MAKLNVYLNRDFVGTLEQDASGALRFTYAADWVTRNDASPLSKMLPLTTEPFEGNHARPFFAGILPEQEPRSRIAEILGISVENDFELLRRIGGECAGAVSLLPEGQKPSVADHDVRPLNEDELIAIVQALPRRPLLADDRELRLSLAGAQDKLPVVIDGDTIGLPLGNTPSTHIIKPEPNRFPGLVANEYFCMNLARRAGLNVAGVTAHLAGKKPCIIVSRYDRIPGPGGIETKRLHQEDFCQALGQPPERKYQQEGGPTIRDCVALLREWSTTPALDILAFVDALIFNNLIGNADAHGKNYAMLYDRGTRRMAPLYDLVSTIAWPGLSKLPAMSLGGQSSINDLNQNHFKRMAEETSLGWPSVRERVHEVAKRVLAATEDIDGISASDEMAGRMGKSIAVRCRRVLKS